MKNILLCNGYKYNMKEIGFKELYEIAKSKCNPGKIS